jgi:hypothetical protein
MSREYQKQISNQLKNINKRYVSYEDKKDLVGGNFNELVEVKEGMGLKGKGLSTTLDFPAGAGLSASGMSGMKKYKKGKKQVENVEICESCGGGISGAGISGTGMSAGGMSAGGILDLLKLPLKVLGFGKDGEEVEIEGAGIFDLLNPIKMLKLAKNVVFGSGMKVYIKKGGIGEFEELEGGNIFQKGFEGLLKSRMREGGPLSEYPGLISGKGMSAGVNNVARVVRRAKRATTFDGGALNKQGTRNGNQAIEGSGMSAGAILGYEGKGKGRKMKGKGLLDIVSKIANAPSDFMNDILGHSNPLEDIVGRENVRKYAVDVVGKKLGLGKKRGAGMGSRPTTQNMPSSSFSGGKKVNKRAEVVRKVMKERGVSMIEASKIVKKEGLY